MMDKETLARYWMWNGASCGKLKERRDAFVDTQHRVMEDERLSGAWAKYCDDRFWGSWRLGNCGDRPGRIAVERELLVHVVHTLAAAHPEKRVVALNPGSATQPGGNVHIGFEGTEESFCLCSNLYSTLATETSWRKFYMKHLGSGTRGVRDTDPGSVSDYICSQNITIFKEMCDGVPRLLPENAWRKVDVITCAPPDFDDYWSMHGGDSALNRAMLYSQHLLRGRNIFELAANREMWHECVRNRKEPDILVLPAFGCDYRKNPPDIVAEAYAELLRHFAGYFETIVFAAGEHRTVFREVFEKNGLALHELDEMQGVRQEMQAPELELWPDTLEQDLEEKIHSKLSGHANGVSWEDNHTFKDITFSLLTIGCNIEARVNTKGLYTAGIFDDGVLFIAEIIYSQEMGNKNFDCQKIEKEFLMFYMRPISGYEQPREGADDEKEMLVVPMVPSQEILEERAFVSNMKLLEISEDMHKFESYVRYIAGQGILESTSSRYRGALQYMTDSWGESIVCVMIALRDGEKFYANPHIGKSDFDIWQ